MGEISTCREVVVFVFRFAALPFTWISKGKEVVVYFVRLRKISSRGEVFADATVLRLREISRRRELDVVRCFETQRA